MRQLVRVLTVAVTGTLALVGVASGTANASVSGSTANTSVSSSTASATVTSGTGTIYMIKSYIHHMAAHNIAMKPLDAQSTAIARTFTTTVYSATGGDADLRTFTGAVQYSGGTLVTNTVTGKQLELLALKYDLANGQIDYLVMNTGGTPIVGFDLAGTQQCTIDGNTQTYSASKLLVSAAAASAMDSVLDTDAFRAGDLMGSFTTTYTVRPDGSGSGVWRSI
jgi:hypothetical protein